MRTFLLLLLALVPSLASAQFTAAQRNGIIKSAIDIFYFYFDMFC